MAAVGVPFLPHQSYHRRGAGTSPTSRRRSNTQALGIHRLETDKRGDFTPLRQSWKWPANLGADVSIPHGLSRVTVIFEDGTDIRRSPVGQ